MFNQLSPQSSAQEEPSDASQETPNIDEHHNFPSFTTLDVDKPVLYLPPFISSLPDNFSPAPLPDVHPPMVTETRLPDIDPVSLSLHKALHSFKPYDSDYASKAYAEAFNWTELRLPEDEEREWYCVAFRSRRKAGSDGTREQN